MITTELYYGQGLGNQLWSYAILRTLSLKKGYSYGVQSPERFKGKGFLDLDFGKKVLGVKSDNPNYRRPLGIDKVYFESRVIDIFNQSNITPFDMNLLEVSDKTKIEGYFQSENYLIEYKSLITEWFSHSSPPKVSENLCVINFRGGEYFAHKGLMLKPEFYFSAIKHMLRIRSDMSFVVVTDDPKLAQIYFPNFPISSKSASSANIDKSSKVDLSKISDDFGLIQAAPYLIISNSSFSWWGAWTNAGVRAVIAPKYWALHNASDGHWSLGDSLTRDWLWQDRYGNLQTYEECKLELESFRNSFNYLESLEINNNWVRKKNVSDFRKFLLSFIMRFHHRTLI